MKNNVFSFLSVLAVLIACNNKDEIKKTDIDFTATANTVKLPYKASYSTSFNNNVSDSDLLAVLNSYKHWETGDMNALRGTLADSIAVDGADTFKFNGRADSLIKIWGRYRDSLSSVTINISVWLKNHELKDSSNFINVWYNEIDTYKSGKVDSANYADINMVKNGKIVWYSQFKQKPKP